METVVTTLAPYHQEQLAAKAIPLEIALAAGVRSILKGSELPEELVYLGNQVPGILYQHTRVNGEVVHQYRPDTPLVPEKKYIQAAGTGAVITVHPFMKDRVPTAKKLMVVEGTKQHLAAVTLALADPDLLVVGVQGCRNWSKDRMLVPDFDELAFGKTTIIIAFDGDFKTNPNVWDGVDLLGKNLEGITGVEALVLDLPVSGKDGFDDYFGGRSAATRPNLFNNHMARAKPLSKIKRVRPKASRGSRIAPTVDIVGGEIRGIGFENEPGPVIAEFAARITHSEIFTDDLNEGSPASVTHTIEVQVGGMDDHQLYVVKDVADSELRNIRAWLERIPGGEGTRLAYDNTETGLRAIEQAIRAHESEKAVMSPRFLRTGWAPALADGRYGYLHAGGIIGPEGEDGSASADLMGTYKRINYPDPAGISPKRLSEAVKRHIGMIDCLNDPTPWYAMMGSIFFSHAGVLTASVVFVVGGKGSGKSHVARVASSCLSPAFAPAGGGIQMASADGTENALGDAGVGLHHSAIIVDDLRTPRTQKAQDVMNAGQERLARRGYAGGSAGKDRLAVSTSGPRRLTRDAADASSPAIILVGEHLPNAADVPSTVERMLSVTVTGASTMKTPEATVEMRDAAASGDLQRAFAGYIQWLAVQIDAAGSLTSWQGLVQKKREDVQEMLKQRYPELDTPRSREIPAPVIVGWTMFLDYAVSAGAITELEAKRIAKDVWTRIAAAAVRHTAVELGDGGDEGLTTLDRIRSALASGKFQLEEALNAPVPSRAPVVGKRHVQKDGRKYLALLPAVVAEAFGHSQNGDGSGIKMRLNKIAEPDAKGNIMRAVRVCGVTTKCLLIPIELWELVDENDSTMAEAA